MSAGGNTEQTIRESCLAAGPALGRLAAMRARGMICFFGSALAAAAQPAPAPAPVSAEQLYQAGQQLFDQYAPPEVKAQYAFPTQADWDQFAGRLQAALNNNSLGDLAALAPEARSALAAARVLPETKDYADWLALRLDEMEAAQESLAPPRPSPQAGPAPRPGVPLYELWRARARSRPLPPGASVLMPRLRSAFAREGIPPELAWIAEAESDLNPAARSPAGARGLFQLMPDTAHALGLGTFLPDERTDPDKSALAAARYLHGLHAKFGSWPLALAAYNAGEGRVQRLLAARGASDFAGIAPALPAETRLYVPKVLALVDLRTGVRPAQLERPRS
jgi:membrane-bound lytic murein transglycosylase D